MRSNKVPLNPDGFTRFGSSDKNFNQHNANLFEGISLFIFLFFFLNLLKINVATIRLLTEVIPQFANQLDQLDQKKSDADIETLFHSFRLIEEMHRAGIKFKNYFLFLKKKFKFFS